MLLPHHLHYVDLASGGPANLLTTAGRAFPQRSTRNISSTHRLRGKTLLGRSAVHEPYCGPHGVAAGVRQLGAHFPSALALPQLPVHVYPSGCVVVHAQGVSVAALHKAFTLRIRFCCCTCPTRKLHLNAPGAAACAGPGRRHPNTLRLQDRAAAPQDHASYCVPHSSTMHSANRRRSCPQTSASSLQQLTPQKEQPTLQKPSSAETRQPTPSRCKRESAFSKARYAEQQSHALQNPRQCPRSSRSCGCARAHRGMHKSSKICYKLTTTSPPLL